MIGCVCYLEPANFTNARYLVRKLARHFAAGSRILRTSGASAPTTRAISTRSEATGCELIATTLREAVERALYFAKHAGLDEALNRDGVNGGVIALIILSSLGERLWSDATSARQG